MQKQPQPDKPSALSSLEEVESVEDSFAGWKLKDVSDHLRRLIVRIEDLSKQCCQFEKKLNSYIYHLSRIINQDQQLFTFIQGFLRKHNFLPDNSEYQSLNDMVEDARRQSSGLQFPNVPLILAYDDECINQQIFENGESLLYSKSEANEESSSGMDRETKSCLEIKVTQNTAQTKQCQSLTRMASARIQQINAKYILLLIGFDDEMKFLRYQQIEEYEITFNPKVIKLMTKNNINYHVLFREKQDIDRFFTHYERGRKRISEYYYDF